MQRRDFLTLTAASLLAAKHATSSNAEDLPPVRAITRGPKFHWFGYYDKLQFDPASRLVLGNEVDFEGRTPTEDDVIKVGVVDTGAQDRWAELGETRAWNWQQGCMLQWIPGSKTEVIWNDRRGEQFVAHVLDVKTKKRRTLPAPIYALSPDGRFAVLPDFRRLNETRPGYGYAGVADPHRAERAPKEAGLWRMEMKTGKTKLLFSFADVAAIPYRDGVKYVNDPAKSKHWFNHLLYAPDGRRFLFLHRWREVTGNETRQQLSGGGAKPFSTRMLTCDADGSNLYVVDPYGKTSHFIWRDPQHICAWAWHPSRGDKFYLYRDRTEQVEVVAPDVMTENGHNTYLPGKNNEWILNDTYPDKNRLQHPYLYHIPTNRRFPLGHFHSPPEYVGEWRCDTHPRFSPDARKVVIDSAHAGGRQMYLIDIGGIVAGR
jgi:hypothetical protein